MLAAGTSISVLVASLDDVYASKRAADRPTDRAYFEASEESWFVAEHKLRGELAPIRWIPHDLFGSVSRPNCSRGVALVAPSKEVLTASQPVPPRNLR